MWVSRDVPSIELDSTEQYYDNPFENRNWERHNLGSPNVLLDLRTLQLYAELPAADDEPLDPASGAGRLDEESTGRCR